MWANRRITGQRNQATGDAGEEVFERLTRTLGWDMDRVQPPTRRVWNKGVLTIITLPGKEGVWDYTGYGRDGQWIACEVKTAHGDTMPCSRVEKAQRDWAARKPLYRLFVAILWLDTGRMEIHAYQPRGSYSMIERHPMAVMERCATEADRRHDLP